MREDNRAVERSWRKGAFDNLVAPGTAWGSSRKNCCLTRKSQESKTEQKVNAERMSLQRKRAQDQKQEYETKLIKKFILGSHHFPHEIKGEVYSKGNELIWRARGHREGSKQSAMEVNRGGRGKMVVCMLSSCPIKLQKLNSKCHPVHVSMF